MSERDELYENAKALARDLERQVEFLNRIIERNGYADERWDDMEDRLREELEEYPLSVERIVTYRVTLGTGGPACGVDWHPNGNAQAWWQEWFTERVYADLDDEAAETLASSWCVDLMMDEDENREYTFT